MDKHTHLLVWTRRIKGGPLKGTAPIKHMRCFDDRETNYLIMWLFRNRAVEHIHFVAV